MRVVTTPLSPDNPYLPALYGPLAGRYDAASGDLHDAREALRSGNGVLFHLQHEEEILRHAPTAVEARPAVEAYLGDLAGYVEAGGRLIWTIQTEQPLNVRHAAMFKRLRQRLAELAARIVVHDIDALDALSSEIPIDRRKVHLLPHPSWLGLYEPADETLAGLQPASSRTLLAFGRLQREKGFNDLALLLPEKFIAAHRAELVFAGPATDDAYPDELKSCFAGRDHVGFAIGPVARQDVPRRVRDSACLVQPCTRFLTPGIAVLGLTFGRPVVAPDSASLRALLPRLAHRFLFDPSSPLDFRRAVTEALDLGEGELFSVRAALLDHAHYLRPQRSGRAFGRLLDDVVMGVDPVTA